MFYLITPYDITENGIIPRKRLYINFEHIHYIKFLDFCYGVRMYRIVSNEYSIIVRGEDLKKIFERAAVSDSDSFPSVDLILSDSVQLHDPTT